jgi:hypothetical protein
VPRTSSGLAGLALLLLVAAGGCSGGDGGSAARSRTTATVPVATFAAATATPTPAVASTPRPATATATSTPAPSPAPSPSLTPSPPSAPSPAPAREQSFRELAAGNVVLREGFAYAALGVTGLAVIDLAAGTATTQPPPTGLGSVDDLAVADGLLFVLDAVPQGFLVVLSLADRAAPRLVSGPVAVPVGPFAGVSAGGGRVVVSGGTGLLTVRTYDAAGALGSAAATVDLGVGQPDVLVAPDGSRAFVSVDFTGAEFGVAALTLGTPPAAPTPSGRVVLPGAGFTPGVAMPANFPIECALTGTTLLVAFGGGLAVIDASDPATLRLLTVLRLGVSAVGVDAFGGRAYVVGSAPAPTLVEVDVSDPRAPTVARSVPLPRESQPLGVAVDERYIVIAARPGGLMVRPRG